MATWTLTFLPIHQVLRNGGEMIFSDLAAKLIELDPRRFRDVINVERAITTYAHCLEYDAQTGTVRFNKEAGRYARFGMMERSIQFALHESVPSMEDWQLYPLKTRRNSGACYLGISWESIPRDPDNERKNVPYEDDCDFREEGEDNCRAGCGVSEEVLRKYSLI